jgi:hypothetical protein
LHTSKILVKYCTVYNIALLFITLLIMGKSDLIHSSSGVICLTSCPTFCTCKSLSCFFFFFFFFLKKKNIKFFKKSLFDDWSRVLVLFYDVGIKLILFHGSTNWSKFTYLLAYSFLSTCPLPHGPSQVCLWPKRITRYPPFNFFHGYFVDHPFEDICKWISLFKIRLYKFDSNLVCLINESIVKTKLSLIIKWTIFVKTRLKSYKARINSFFKIFYCIVLI